MDWLRRIGGTWLRGGLLGLAVALASLVGLLDPLERYALDQQFALRGRITPKTPIVIVSIHEDSFHALNMQWPWPRALHAKFLDIVSRGKPAAIGFDLIWSEPSHLGPEDDRALGEAIGKAGNVVLGAAFSMVEQRRVVGRYGYILGTISAPIPIIRERAAAYGFVNFDQDWDAFVRSTILSRPYEGKSLSHFTVHLYGIAAKAGLPASALPEGQTLLINFRGGPGTFETISYYRVLSGEVGPETFAGKIVLVGATSPVLHDVFPTPFARDATMPGVEIQANTLETLFQGIPIRRAPRGLGIALTIAAGLGAVWLTARLRPVVALAVLAGATGGYAVATFAAFAWGRVWMEVGAVPLTLVLGYGATVVERFLQEQREKRRLSRFFSPNVVKDILRQKSDINLISTRREMTVLFSDIRGFTSISEKLRPEDIVAFLREYLTVMTEAVFAHGGTVDKYIGDAIMALYNVPFDQPDHAAQAVRTALAFQERLRPLAERFREKHGFDIRCGVGINTGEALVGTIGSEQRLEYTAIGDTINLGARLESLTKDFKVPIVISESTHQAVQGQFLTRVIGEVTVKGKEIPVRIYGVEEGETRREVRVRMEAGITALVIEGDLRIHAAVADLSRGGVCLEKLPKEFTKGEMVQLSFQLPGAGVPPPDLDQRVVLTAEQITRLVQGKAPPSLEVFARVSWVAKDKAGFQFTDLKPDDRAALEAFVARHGSPRKARTGPPPPS